MVLATRLRTFRKNDNRHGTIAETAKVLKLSKNEAKVVSVVYEGKHIKLTAVDGAIEVQEVSDNFSAFIAGKMVEHFQGLYDTVKAKLANT